MCCKRRRGRRNTFISKSDCIENNVYKKLTTLNSESDGRVVCKCASRVEGNSLELGARFVERFACGLNLGPFASSQPFDHVRLDAFVLVKRVLNQSFLNSNAKEIQLPGCCPDIIFV